MGTDKESRIKPIGLPNDTGSVFIRKCTLEDLEGVISVNEKELPEDYPYFFYKSILDNYNESFLVALNNRSKIIGYIMWRVEKVPAHDSLKILNKGHLVSIAILKKWRKIGIATALLNESMKEIKKKGIDEYVLEVRVSNYSAINLYKKFGFFTKNIKYKYYRDGENAYFMIKKVNSDLEV